MNELGRLGFYVGCRQPGRMYASWSDSHPEDGYESPAPAFHSRNLKLRPFIAFIEHYRICRWNQRSYGVERVDRRLVIVTPKLATHLEAVRGADLGPGKALFRPWGAG